MPGGRPRWRAWSTPTVTSPCLADPTGSTGPAIRPTGCWLTRTGSLPSGLPVEVEDGDGLLAAALGQLDAGADLVEL
jgi:hypothetical protein